MPEVIPFGEWVPDQAAFHQADAARASDASGVVPLTARSYGPFQTFAEVSSNALTARCQGAHSGRNKSGDVKTFAGDATKLYERTGTTWADVSKPATTYGVTSEDNWHFVRIGDRIIALNLADYPQRFDLSSGTTFIDLGTTTYLPKARFGAQIGDWLMLGNLNDVSGGGLGLSPSRVWWSEKGNATSWPQPATSTAAAMQSGYSSEMSGGWVRGIVGAVGGLDGVVLCEDALYRIVVAGPPAVFDFFPVVGARGCWVPTSIHNFGRGVLYLAEDGWYVFDGTTTTPVGSQRIDRWFLDQLDPNYVHRISVWGDPDKKIVVISFPGSGSSGGTPNTLLIWNWEINRWSYAAATVDLLFHDHSVGYTLEQLDPFGTLETLPFSLDSRSWAGGLSLLGGFSTGRKSGAFSGPAQVARLVTQEFEAGGRRVFVSGFRPIVDGNGVSGSLLYRDTQDGAYSTTPATAQDVSGVCRVRAEGRYVKARVDIPAGISWRHAIGVEVDETLVRPTSQR